MNAPALLLAAALTVAGWPTAATADPATPAAAAAKSPELWRLAMAAGPPPCAPAASLPVVPADPGPYADPDAPAERRSGGRGPDGGRCYGTAPAELELWLPTGASVWLERRTLPAAAVWVAVGPVLVDPQALEPTPLALRLHRADAELLLETRQGGRATLTPLEPGVWRSVQLANGLDAWVQAMPAAAAAQPEAPVPPRGRLLRAD
jgi:hypothetical protein